MRDRQRVINELNTRERQKDMLTGRIAQFRSHHITSGQVRSGQVRSGQVRSGQTFKIPQHIKYFKVHTIKLGQPTKTEDKKMIYSTTRST